MTDKGHHSEALQNVFERLADSVFELSDEEICDEVRKAGADPEEYAERTRAVLLQALQKFDNVNKHLRNLGHIVSPKDWHAREWGCESKCRNCGLSVSFATASSEIWGEALFRPCRAKDQYESPERKAARR